MKIRFLNGGLSMAIDSFHLDMKGVVSDCALI